MNLGTPQITPDKFSLDRLQVSLGNTWVATGALTLASNTGAMLILPSATQPLVIHQIVADCSVAEIIVIGTATGLTAPTDMTVTNHYIGSARVPTFTAQQAFGNATGFVPLYRFILSATIESVNFYLNDNPIILPAGSATGLAVLTNNNISGVFYASIVVQEYPY